MWGRGLDGNDRCYLRPGSTDESQRRLESMADPTVVPRWPIRVGPFPQHVRYNPIASEIIDWRGDVRCNWRPLLQNDVDWNGISRD